MGLPEFLSRLGTDPSAPVSHQAISELSGLTSPEAAELARVWASWQPGRLRSFFDRLAGMAADDPGLDFEVVLIQGLDSRDPDIRRQSVRGLADSTDRRLASRFADMLERDPDHEVRLTIAEAMSNLCDMAAVGQLHPRDVSLLSSALIRVASGNTSSRDLRLRALETVAVLGGEPVAALIQQAYAAGDTDSVRSALLAMGRTCDPRWISAVLANLDAADTAIRTGAVAALGEIGDETHPHLLAPALDDTELGVQVAAVAALEKLGGPAARKLLAGAVRSPEPTVAEAAAAALGGLADEEALSEVIGPDMRQSGGMFGGPGAPDAGDDDDDYDAPAREGWSGFSQRGPDGDEGRDPP